MDPEYWWCMYLLVYRNQIAFRSIDWSHTQYCDLTNSLHATHFLVKRIYSIKGSPFSLRALSVQPKYLTIRSHAHSLSPNDGCDRTSGTTSHSDIPRIAKNFRLSYIITGFAVVQQRCNQIDARYGGYFLAGGTLCGTVKSQEWYATRDLVSAISPTWRERRAGLFIDNSAMILTDYYQQTIDRFSVLFISWF